MSVMNVRLSNQHGTVEISGATNSEIASLLSVFAPQVLRCHLSEIEVEAIRSGDVKAQVAAEEVVKAPGPQRRAR